MSYLPATCCKHARGWHARVPQAWWGYGVVHQDEPANSVCQHLLWMGCHTHHCCCSAMAQIQFFWHKLVRPTSHSLAIHVSSPKGRHKAMPPWVLLLHWGAIRIDIGGKLVLTTSAKPRSWRADPPAQSKAPQNLLTWLQTQRQLGSRPDHWSNSTAKRACLVSQVSTEVNVNLNAIHTDSARAAVAELGLLTKDGRLRKQYCCVLASYCRWHFHLRGHLCYLRCTMSSLTGCEEGGKKPRLTSPQVDENAEPTAYSTKFLQAVAKAGYPLLAICSTASRSQTYSRQSVCATTRLQRQISKPSLDYSRSFSMYTPLAQKLEKHSASKELSKGCRHHKHDSCTGLNEDQASTLWIWWLAQLQYRFMLNLSNLGGVAHMMGALSSPM